VRNARRLRSSPALGHPGSASNAYSTYCAVSGAGLAMPGGHCGHGGDSGAQAATSTINGRRVPRMWVVYLEILLALALAVFIVWWTWPKKRKDRDQ
jgi:hypothetical protein